MSLFFEINNNRPYPTAEALMIPLIKSIWTRDKSKSKESALKDLGYIEFMISPEKTNPFRGYPEEEKEAQIRRHFIIDKKWKPDALVREAMMLVQESLTEGSEVYSYWRDAKIAAENTRKYLKEIDLNSRTDKGVPLYKPKDVTSALGDTERVIQALISLRKKVDEENSSRSRIMADKETSLFSNPNDVIHE
jgi:hypothetical protein